MRKRPLAILFSVVVVDLIGFGIIMPILPFYADRFGANAKLFGLLLTVYAAMQFCFAPLWGRLSDRIGRRKVLALTLFAGSLSLLVLGSARSLLWIFIGRTLSGIFAANVSVASAYVTDVTSAADRAKGMGMIGAAFGIGFILGPAISGVLAPYGYPVPIFVAAGLTGINALLAAVRLPEPNRHTPQEVPHLARTFEQTGGQMRRLLIMNFLYTAGVAQLETTLAYFLKDRFFYDAHHTARVFVFMAVIMVAVQGGLIRHLAERWSERLLLLWGSVALAGALAAIPFMPGVALLLTALAASSLGRGLSQPALFSLASQQAAPTARGSVMGAFQSAASLARVVGPCVGGLLYDWSPVSVFIGSALCLIAVVYAGLPLRARVTAPKILLLLLLGFGKHV